MNTGDRARVLHVLFCYNSYKTNKQTEKPKQRVQPGMDILSIDYFILLSMANLLTLFEGTENGIYNYIVICDLNYALHLIA